MNKAELEKEAEEKYHNHKIVDFQGFYNHHYYYLGYVESAEPREKRIAELEKENAELKHTIAELRRDKDNLNTHTKAQEKLSEYRSNQLTKAKEVINDLVHLGEFNEHTDEEYFNYQVHEVLKNAEQFISEVEK